MLTTYLVCVDRTTYACNMCSSMWSTSFMLCACLPALIRFSCKQGVEGAVAAACSMVEQGADIIDIGGQSTRPGASRLSTEEEVQRVVPVIRC